MTGPVTCGWCGEGCANPDSVDPTRPCDSAGPVCLPLAYECPCATCSTR